MAAMDAVQMNFAAVHRTCLLTLNGQSKTSAAAPMKQTTAVFSPNGYDLIDVGVFKKPFGCKDYSDVMDAISQAHSKS